MRFLGQMAGKDLGRPDNGGVSMKTVATRRRRISRTVMVGAFVALSLTSLYAFRSVFGRPGENAMALIPANALIAGSIDLRPGPAQALMFKNIDDALARNGDKEPTSLPPESNSRRWRPAAPLCAC